MIVCGWDGGGSKTTVCLMDQGGTILDQASFGPLNPNGTDPETVRKTIHDAVQYMTARSGGPTACRRVVIGTAGISNQAVREKIFSCLLNEGLDEDYLLQSFALMGDHEIALAGAIEGPGAILIAGTGSVCYGRDAEGRLFRAGGYGHLIDDAGSGYAIGRDILKAVVRAEDGRGAPTCLTEEVHAFLKISTTTELITWLYNPKTGKKDVAALAPLLLPAFQQEDDCALRITGDAAFALAELAIAGLSCHGVLHGELAMTGSILTHYPVIRQITEDTIRLKLPGIAIISPRRTPAEGAALLALKSS